MQKLYVFWGFLWVFIEVLLLSIKYQRLPALCSTLQRVMSWRVHHEQICPGVCGQATQFHKSTSPVKYQALQLRKSWTAGWLHYTTAQKASSGFLLSLTEWNLVWRSNSTCEFFQNIVNPILWSIWFSSTWPSFTENLRQTTHPGTCKSIHTPWTFLLFVTLQLQRQIFFVII